MNNFWKDQSFQDFLKCEHEFRPLIQYLEEGLPKNKEFDNIHSSYSENNYCKLFYGLVRLLKPMTCVEVGVLEGYSLFSMAYAIIHNRKDVMSTEIREFLTAFKRVATE